MFLSGVFLFLKEIAPSFFNQTLFVNLPDCDDNSRL